MGDVPDGMGQTVDLIAASEWAAREGTDKSFRHTAVNQAADVGISASYTVPAGKTLYICGYSFSGYSFLAADRDKLCPLVGFLLNNTTATYNGDIGGLNGASLVFNKPVVVEAEQQIAYYVYNRSGFAVTMSIFMWGYEV